MMKYERYQDEGRGEYAARLYYMSSLSLRDKYRLLQSAGVPGDYVALVFEAIEEAVYRETRGL